jgi:hypothetical protein
VSEQMISGGLSGRAGLSENGGLRERGAALLDQRVVVGIHGGLVLAFKSSTPSSACGAEVQRLCSFQTPESKRRQGVEGTACLLACVHKHKLHTSQKGTTIGCAPTRLRRNTSQRRILVVG